jgi:hypothetical protein
VTWVIQIGQSVGILQLSASIAGRSDDFQGIYLRGVPSSIMGWKVQWSSLFEVAGLCVDAITFSFPESAI